MHTVLSRSLMLRSPHNVGALATLLKTSCQKPCAKRYCNSGFTNKPSLGTCLLFLPDTPHDGGALANAPKHHRTDTRNQLWNTAPDPAQHSTPSTPSCDSPASAAHPLKHSHSHLVPCAPLCTLEVKLNKHFQQYPAGKCPSSHF